MEPNFSSSIYHTSTLSALPCNVSLHSFSRVSASLSPACTPHQSTHSHFSLAFLEKISSCESHLLRFHSGKTINFITAFPDRVSTDSAVAPTPRSRLNYPHTMLFDGFSSSCISDASWVLQKLGRKYFESRAGVLLFDLFVSPEQALAEEASEVAGDQTAQGATNTFLSFLAVAAFLALFTLTVGVIYLSVSDFMEKRSIDAQTKDAESKKKKNKTEEEDNAARIGPKGFGSKIRKGK